MANFEVKCFDPQNPDAPCSVCGGLGVIKYSVEPEDPRFGKFFRCKNNPVELDIDHQQRLRKLSNLDAFRDKTFSSFDVDVHQSLRYAAEMSVEFVETLTGWIVFEGKYGSGKTHLAAAIGNECLQRGENVLFMTTPDLLDHLRSTFSPRSEVQYDELFERIKSVTVLILDDLGVENPSPWAQEKLFQVLNHRYTNKLPTVITTNVDINELDPRISSRLQDTDIIRNILVSAPDFRKKYDMLDTLTGDKVSEIVNLQMYKNMTFETFEVETAVTRDEYNNLNNGKNLSLSYVHQCVHRLLDMNASEVEKPWLLFMGTHGSGKTHLAASIANYAKQLLVEAGTQGIKPAQKVIFVKAPDYLDYLKSTFAPDSSVSADKLTQLFRSASILILDDLDTKHASPWAKEKLIQLLDYRYNYRTNTVVTTSQNMDTIDDRLQTRFGDIRVCVPFAISAGSYADRLRRPQNRR